jgi:hypothetical protein
LGHISASHSVHTCENLRFAAKYGYDLVFYQLIDRDLTTVKNPKLEGVCRHPVDGPRQACWCKIPAIHHALFEEGKEAPGRLVYPIEWRSCHVHHV